MRTTETSFPVNFFPKAVLPADQYRARRTRHRNGHEQNTSYVDIQENLFPYPLSLFKRLTPQLQEEFVSSMYGVVRMQSLRDKGFPMPPGFFETNLHHLKEGNDMALEYRKKAPNLREFIDFGRVQAQHLVHDVGEPHPAIKDRPPIDRTPEDEKAKRLEPYAAERLIRRVSDPELREEIRGLYREVVANDPSNLDVQMQRFIDKAQGTTRVAHIVYNKERVKDDATLNRMRLHLWGTVSRMMEPALNLLVGLPTKAAREEMRSIVVGELALLEQYGPKEVPRSFMRGVVA